MQLEGLREGQVAQVRGFADQQLYKKDDPGHPSNRRITIIVQYDSPHPDATEPAKAAAGEHHENPPAKSEHHASK
jgi:chemotaxis protein MotB